MTEDRAERFIDELRAVLGRHAAATVAPRYAVAFSGGLDSTVLLAAMARAVPVATLRALHVDHALHAQSADWERHCRDVAAELGVACESVRVEVDRAGGSGLEAAARAARYTAFASRLAAGETLLTAHHADDQLETLLLRLFRGTGVRGLRGILRYAPLGPGAVLRPLLDVSRNELAEVAAALRLRWLEDPSNRDLVHDRNYLRARVLPLVRERWGAAASSAGRLAAAMTDAEQVLTAMAQRDLSDVAADSTGEPAAGELPTDELTAVEPATGVPRTAANPATAAMPVERPAARDRIPLDPLRRLDPARRRNALRFAIRDSDLPMPTARQLHQVCAAVDVARPDAETRVQWPGGEARVYRGLMYLFRPLPAREPGELRTPGRVGVGQPWSGPEGRLTLEPCTDAEAPEMMLPDAWARAGLYVRFRTGGERFKPEGDAHTRSLKTWFQREGILPWMRERIPLLYREDRLVAIADLAMADLSVADPAVVDDATPPDAAVADPAVADAAVAVTDEAAPNAGKRRPRWRVCWSDHPNIR